MPTDVPQSDAAIDTPAPQDVAADDRVVMRDAPDDVCVLSCPAPPPGCRWSGPVSCNPPSCGTLVCEDAGANDVPATDAPVADVSPNDAAADASASGITCNAPGGSFPAIDQRCAMASDCVAVFHQTDCCGNSAAIGIATSQRASFDAAETACRMLFPRCGCPAQAPLADDGNRSFDMNQVGVVCRMNRCFTYVRQ